MTSLTRLAVWVGGLVGAVVLAWVATAWRADAAVSPTVARLQPQPPMPRLEPTVLTSPLPVLPAEAASAPAAAATAAPRSPLPDGSRMQREIQLALHNPERGAARKALKYLHDCSVATKVGPRQRASLEEERHRMTEAAFMKALTRLEEEQRSCQAIDANAHAQWVPLLRRSLAEGDEGVAAHLVLALGERFDAAAEPEIVAGLLRDAWACDGLAFGMLRPLARSHSPLLDPSVAGAVNALDHAQITAFAKANPMRPAELARELAELVPPANADPAKLARLVSDMKARCPDEGQ